MSENRAEAQMSSHFGKAEWIMIEDSEDPDCAFEKNVALNGKGAAEIAIRQGCADLILVDIGDGALGHLQRAHIRAWTAPEPMDGDQALRLFKLGKLLPVPPVLASHKEGRGQGCCCGHHKGAEASACCHG